MLRTTLRALVLFGAVLAAGGSATIIKGTSQPVTITTTPPGAQVFIDNLPVGVSPLTVSVKHAEHTVSATLPGYAPGYARLTTGFSGWTILAFPLGTVIDAITGALMTLDQDQVVIQLGAGGASMGAQPGYPAQPQPQPVGDQASPERH